MTEQDLRERISTNIKIFRKEKNWSQKDLAIQADISEQTINSIEGHRLWPSDKTLVKIANALNIDCEDFLKPTETSTSVKINFDKKLKEEVINSIKKLVAQTLMEI